MKRCAPTILRIGIALVFIWFGVVQLMDPEGWAGWLPAYSASLPLSATSLVYLNGAFETVFGLLLLVGIYTRFSATLLTLHMIHIISVVGYGEIGVRDFGIFIATLSIALHGADKFSWDSFFSRRK